MRQAFSRKWVFVVLPAFYLILSFVFLTGIKQFYISNLDPAYAYLMNGTNLASGHFRIGNILHPGIPVDCFAAIVIFIKHLFSANAVLYQDVLLHPESYLFTCSAVLTFLLSVVTYFAGAYVYRYSGSILLAVFFQISPLFYSEIIRRTISLSAESAIVICGIFFVPYIYINTFFLPPDSDKETTNKESIFCGLLTAVLITDKIYCAPIAVLVFVMMKKKQQQFIYLISTGFISLLLLFPLYNQLKNWLGSIKSMIFHSGPYGQGNAGIINPSIYKSSFMELFSAHYIFAFIYLIIITAFLVSLWGVLKKERQSFASIFPITSILLFYALFTFIVIKQYKFDCPDSLTHTVVTITNFYYFILPIICFPLAITVSYKILYPLFSFQFFSVHRKKLFYVSLAIFVIVGLQRSYKFCYEARNMNVSFEKTRSFIDGWGKTPVIIISNGGDQIYPQPALLLGSAFSGKWDMPQYFNFLKTIYPNTYLYVIGWRYYVEYWGDQTDISKILTKSSQALVYISGADSSQEKITLTRICETPDGQNKVSFEKIYSSDNKYENVYLVKADSLR